MKSILKNQIYHLILFIFCLILNCRAQGSALEDLESLAANSSCGHITNWGFRTIHGKRVEVYQNAPPAYIAGLAVTFTRALCRSNDPQDPFYPQMSRAPASAMDSIAHYADEFRTKAIETETAGPDVLRAIYTLAVGHGIFESSGNYSEGWDRSAHHQTSITAEAGLFQSSYDAMVASAPELRELYNAYLADPSKCFLNIFSHDVTAHHQTIYGSGVGADFQRFEKACPAFATEFEMLNLRDNYGHYGPILRKEVYVHAECDDMFSEVQKYYETNPHLVCSEI